MSSPHTDMRSFRLFSSVHLFSLFSVFTVSSPQAAPSITLWRTSAVLLMSGLSVGFRFRIRLPAGTILLCFLSPSLKQSLAEAGYKTLCGPQSAVGLDPVRVTASVSGLTCTCCHSSAVYAPSATIGERCVWMRARCLLQEVP